MSLHRPHVLRRLTVLVLLVLVGAGLPIGLSGGGAAAAPAGLRDGLTARSATADDDRRPVAALTAAVGDVRLDLDRAFVRPREYIASTVDLAAVRGALAGTPTTTARTAGAPPSRVSLPAPDGTEVVFDLTEDSVMEPALQARHPELRTYAGRGVTDPTDTIRVSVTPLGLSASVRSVRNDRSWYVDPAYVGRGVTTHLSYWRSSVPRPASFEEPEIRTPDGSALPSAAGDSDDPGQRRAGEAVVRRTYRMAFVTTPSYAADFGSRNVLAEKVRVINRANQIYSDDVAIEFVLVDGTEQLNLDTAAKATGANGPCGANACFTEEEIASCGGDGIDRNNFVAGQIIGADRFDIGHLGSGAGSGGVAYLGVVGGELKAGGCTALDEPRGDFYAVDFFAHEVGHQMGGNHTFDGVGLSCAPPNRQATTSIEPGSGSTVMAYAGICGSDDLQPHTDPVFSQRTIDEFTAVTTATPDRLAEQQVVNLRNFAGTDSFLLGYPGATAIRIRNGQNYTTAGLEDALLELTGKAVQVSGNDGARAPGPAGFTLDWPDNDRAARVRLTGFDGATGFVGVTQNGGPTTNRGAAATTSNHRPVVDAGADRQIPILTPFELTGSASDTDAGQQAGLTYLWEQNDQGPPGDPILGFGPGQPLVGDRALGPLFRVFGTYADVSDRDTLMYHSPGESVPGADPSRSFPDLAQVLADNSNAEAPCPATPGDPTTSLPKGAALNCYSELLPDEAYAANPLAGELNFRLTVRDGEPGAGGTGHDDLVLGLDPTVGPFAVTSREVAGSPTTAGETETVTWDVNGTDDDAYAPTVRISVSIDGGRTFPYVVAQATDNDGTEDVTLPRFNTDRGRVKVEAVDNYFYDTNDADFVIRGGVDPQPLPRPETSVTAGPSGRAFVIGSRVRYAFRSSIAGSRFTCRLDGRTIPCGAQAARLRGVTPGTHTFAVAATSPAGRVDLTPVRRRFAVVRDERDLERVTPGWRAVRGESAYRDTLLVANRPGRVLALSVTRAKRIALLVRRGPGFGRVEIRLDGSLLRRVDLSAPRRSRRLAVKTLAAGRSGRLTVRTLSSKRVVIDGVGFLRLPR